MKDPVIRFWEYIQKTPNIWKNICTPLFIAALFKIAKIYRFSAFWLRSCVVSVLISLIK